VNARCNSLGGIGGIIAADYKPVSNLAETPENVRTEEKLVLRAARRRDWCREQDLNLHAFWALDPKSNASANSAIPACVYFN
jgi:hypothetical protein